MPTICSDTLSSRALSRFVAPQSPATSALPSALVSVTGARCQPAPSRVITAGPASLAARPSYSPPPLICQRLGAMAPVKARLKASPLLPAITRLAVPEPPFICSVPVAFSTARLPRSNPARSSAALISGPLAGSSTRAASRSRSTVIGVEKGRLSESPATASSANCTAPAADSLALPVRPLPASASVPANGPAADWSSRPLATKSAAASLSTSIRSAGDRLISACRVTGPNPDCASPSTRQPSPAGSIRAATAVRP